jgi:hypothetical protein
VHAVAQVVLSGVRKTNEWLTPWLHLSLISVAVLMVWINVIRKCHVNDGKAKQLDTLAGIVHFIGGTSAFQRLISVRFQA